MAISGTMETPMPAPTMLSRLLNWPLSKMTWGRRRARAQAATAVSRKQWPSRSNKNGSARRSFRESALRPARLWSLGSAQVFQGEVAAPGEFVIFGKRGEKALGEQRGGFEFVAADGKRQDGDVN